jgi:haloalkane dehalogenase
MANTAEISSAFPYESRHVDVHGSRMHYVEEGEGDPILLLHGNPTSSYLWRNIIPHLSDRGRCIAPDLIGMGRSDRPPLDYRFFDHVNYFEGFIEALGLEHITLVLHDWGSGLGLHYAARHEGNVRGIAMMEAILWPMRWAEFPPDFRRGFKMFRAPVVGALMIQGLNAFLERMMPGTIVRELTAEEKARYAEPYPTWSSRKPVRVWPEEIPIDGKPADVHEAVSAYSEWLQATDMPKLLLHAQPGGIIRPDGVAWCRENLPELELVDLGEGVHYLQEDHPHEIGEAIAAWMDAHLARRTGAERAAI